MNYIDVIGVLFILVVITVCVLFYGGLIWVLIQGDLLFEYVPNAVSG